MFGLIHLLVCFSTSCIFSNFFQLAPLSARRRGAGRRGTRCCISCPTTTSSSRLAALFGGSRPTVRLGSKCGRSHCSTSPVADPQHSLCSNLNHSARRRLPLLPRWALWSGGATAARLAANARQSSTTRSYGRHWAAFAKWCAHNSLEPLPATPDMIAAYIGSIADRGTVAARSLQPYLSAINSVHADFGLERPALGHFAATVRRGMARSQAADATRDTRIPLPAPAVEAVLDDTIAHLAARRPHLHPRPWAALLRARFAFLLAFLFMGRQDSTAPLSSVAVTLGSLTPTYVAPPLGEATQALGRTAHHPDPPLPPSLTRLLVPRSRRGTSRPSARPMPAPS